MRSLVRHDMVRKCPEFLGMSYFVFEHFFSFKILSIYMFTLKAYSYHIIRKCYK